MVIDTTWGRHYRLFAGERYTRLVYIDNYGANPDLQVVGGNSRQSGVPLRQCKAHRGSVLRQVI